MRFIFFIFCNFLIAQCCFAQEQKTTSFTVSNGLPSNYVYRSLEDDRGFLWVATDAGLARFDGKHFQLFTTEQGLPDNVVLSLAKEKNGRIWVNCFKQIPAYYDEIKNRFVKAINDKTLNRLTNTLNMALFPLKEGGVMYHNDKGSIIFKEKKLVESNVYDERFGFLIDGSKDGAQLRYGNSTVNINGRMLPGIFYVKGEKIIDSVLLTAMDSRQAIDDGKFYLFSASNSLSNKCYIYSEFKESPLRFELDSIHIPEPFNNFSFTSTSLYFMAKSGKIYVFNKKTLHPTAIIGGDYLADSYWDDSQGNKWISTIDKGLILYKNHSFKSIEMPGGYLRTNFISIARDKKGAILAGNYYGEVLELLNGKSKVHKVTRMVTSRIRKILLAGEDIYTFSEEGIYFNYKYPILNYTNNKPFPSKYAINFNDSTIIVGTHWGLSTLNTNTNRLEPLSVKHKRVTALVKVNDTLIYFGSNDGLYKYDFINKAYFSLAGNNKILGDRITSLYRSNDQILWVGTASNGMLAMKDNQVIARINTNNINFNSACNNIIEGKPQQIWAATAHGISVINYTLNDKHLLYSTQNLTVNDGLTSNEVQEMLSSNGNIYAATSDGISIIPENFAVSKFDIPVYLIRMSVNQRDTIISKTYDLTYKQQNLQMQFAGVDLSGHFKNIQYTLDGISNWTDLDENTLTVQLSSGKHILRVRAVDVNGNIGSQLLTIRFNIEVPLWKNIWFWIVAAILIQIFTIYYVTQRQKKKREDNLTKRITAVQNAALEQQAFTSLMNPHFLFNALNSIQHYINVQDRQNANRYLSDFASLIRKNFEAAQQSFIPLEEEIENIKIYLRLEQMRFNEGFTYQIKISESLEIEDWMVPTMIMQPLLENALLHGIMPSSIVGEVLIELINKDNDLLIIITDNGVGILNSMALKEVEPHKSRGTELIKKRIKALTLFGPDAITITMETAFESKVNPGNRVIIFIPEKLHDAWNQAQRI